jgi:transposase, IS5 family
MRVRGLPWGVMVMALLRGTGITLAHPSDRFLRGHILSRSAMGSRATGAVYERVLEDLGGRSTTGRSGMPAEQVVRVLILRQTMQWSFEELAFHLEDSTTCRSFCGIGVGIRAPSVGTLKRNCKAISEDAMKGVNRAVIEQATQDGVEDGRTVRGDSTVMETNIHSPTDSTLLWDSIRILTRLMRNARELKVKVVFVDSLRRAKRRIMEIRNAKGIDAKRPLYRDLYAAAEETVHAAEQVAIVLRTEATRSALGRRRSKLASKIEEIVSNAHRVLSQTRRRVFDGEHVPSSEKVVSLTEPHTDIILKGQRRPESGHKVFLASGRSGLILDCKVGYGNPSDSGEAVSTIERVAEVTGRVAKEVSFDGGYASKDNVAGLKRAGVQEVAFHKRCGLAVEEMTSSPTIFARLRRFRAAIEATIGWLKRAFGLRRCHLSGRASFHTHAQAAVAAANLLLLARHDLA